MPKPPYEQFPDVVSDKVQQFLLHGAHYISPFFSVATETQGEVLFNERRLLITPNDEAYHTYVEVMRNAELPYVANSLTMGDERVVVGEIPRDARTLPQVMRGVQPETGIRSDDILNMVGQAVHLIAETSGTIPADLSINRTLLLRMEGQVMFAPPMAFVPADAHNMNEMRESVRGQLMPNYERFGAVALLEAFDRGMQP